MVFEQRMSFCTKPCTNKVRRGKTSRRKKTPTIADRGFSLGETAGGYFTK